MVFFRIRSRFEDAAVHRLARRAPPHARRVVGQRLHLLVLEHGLLRRELVALDRCGTEQLVADVLLQLYQFLQCCGFNLRGRSEHRGDLATRPREVTCRSSYI